MSKENGSLEKECFGRECFNPASTAMAFC